MLKAALDTSITCNLLIYRNDEKVFQGTLDSQSRDNDRNLPPWLVETLASLGGTLNDVRQWTVGTGPGSFAGLRSGIAFIKGICMASGAQLRGVPSCVATAQQANPKPGQKAGVIMDGRCGQILLAIVKDGRLHADPAALDPEDLLSTHYQCDVWITPQPTLIPPLPESVQDNLKKVDCIDITPLILDTATPWPKDWSEIDKSCEPIYVRPPVFVKPIELKNLLA